MAHLGQDCKRNRGNSNVLSHTYIISYVHLRNRIGRRADYKNWRRKTVESFLGKRSHLFGRSLSRARCTSRVLTAKAGTTSCCLFVQATTLSVLFRRYASGPSRTLGQGGKTTAASPMANPPLTHMMASSFLSAWSTSATSSAR